MAHALVLDETTHEVWLARQGTGYRVHVGATSVPVSLQPLGQHAHLLVSGDDTRTVFVAVHGDSIHVHLDGEAYALRYVHSLERFGEAATEDSESTSRAPMPGSVIAVHVQPGQRVARGDVLLVIESMKMETAIAAGRDGVVQSIPVAVGQTFERNATLATLAPVEEAS